MKFLPQKDDVVWYGIGEGDLSAYEVLSVKFEFRKMVTQPEEGDPEEIPTALSACVPVVIVQEGV